MLKRNKILLYVAIFFILCLSANFIWYVIKIEYSFPIKGEEIRKFSSEFNYIFNDANTDANTYLLKRWDKRKKWKLICYYRGMQYTQIQDILLSINNYKQTTTKNIIIGKDEGFNIDFSLNFNPYSNILNIKYGDDNRDINISDLINVTDLKSQIKRQFFALDLDSIDKNLMIIPALDRDIKETFYILVLNNISGQISNTGKIQISSISLTLISDYYNKR